MNTHNIEIFLDRYNKALQGRSKEVRLQMEEARMLAHEIAILMGRSGSLADKVIELQEQLLQEKNNKINSPVQLDLDGGKFS